jgi:hypothetical protein
MVIVSLLHPPPNKPLQRTWRCCADIARGRIAESQASRAAVQGCATPLNADPLGSAANLASAWEATHPVPGPTPVVGDREYLYAVWQLDVH